MKNKVTGTTYGERRRVPRLVSGTASLPPRSEEHPLREAATRLSEGEERELIRIDAVGPRTVEPLEQQIEPVFELFDGTTLRPRER